MTASTTTSQGSVDSRPLPPPHVRRIGQHEAGHWVVARSFGFEVGAIVMRLGGHPTNSKVLPEGSSRVFLQRNLPAVADIATFMRERIQILYAGAVGQALTDGRVDEAIVKEAFESNADIDVGKAEEYLEMLLNIERGADPMMYRSAPRLDAKKALSDAIYVMTRERVMQHAAPIECIGLEIARRAVLHPYAREVLTVAEIEALLAAQGWSMPSLALNVSS